MQAKLRKDLIIQSVAGETIVFDPMSAEAHYLNERATRVFRACQQKKEHQDTADVRYALSLFQEKGLLEDSDVLEQATRRQALQLMGKVALLPALTTAMLPTPAAAMSGVGVTEADCIMGVAGACGQVCTDGPIPGVSVCGSDGVNPGCACISAAVVAMTGCMPDPC